MENSLDRQIVTVTTTNNKTFTAKCSDFCNPRDDSFLQYDEKSKKHELRCSSCNYLWDLLTDDDLKYL